MQEKTLFYVSVKTILISMEIMERTAKYYDMYGHPVGPLSVISLFTLSKQSQP